MGSPPLTDAKTLTRRQFLLGSGAAMLALGTRGARAAATYSSEKPVSAVIFSPQANTLTPEEKTLFRDMNPFGYIISGYLCSSPEKVKNLIDELKSLSGNAHLPVFMDQEGGKTARLRPPFWPAYPPAAIFGALAKKDPQKAALAVYLNARLIGNDLASLGITINIAPVADVAITPSSFGGHSNLGERSYGSDTAIVTALARANAFGLMDSGVLPVLKHIPGLGRSMVDSHKQTPFVTASLKSLRATDFVPFQSLNSLPMAMTSHACYTAIDPENVATESRKVINLIRNEIGFTGLLISDDLQMAALAGDLETRARLALAAGCDVVLVLNPIFADKLQAARGVGPLKEGSLAPIRAALANIKPAPADYDYTLAKNIRNELLASL